MGGMNKKLLVRHHLDAYSEEEFARLLEKKGEMAFFPFKDIGIDIISMNKETSEVKCFQLKARNIDRSNGEYWFQVRPSLEKLRNFKNFYWVFCALKEGTYNFDFFVVPNQEIEDYFKKATEKDEFFQIKPKEHGYIIIPKRSDFNINKYKFE